VNGSCYPGLVRTPALAVVLVICAAGSASAREPGSYWNPSHTRIYTIRADGTRVPGGQVGDVRMIQVDSLLGPGGVVLEFVQSRTRSGGALRWDKSCVLITPDAAGSADIAGDEELAILDRVLANWETSTRSCGYLTFERQAPLASEVGFDGVNLVKYREDRWCRPATDEDPEECYNGQAAAITTLFFIDRPGEADDGTLLDADIEVNEVNFAMASDCAGAGGCQTLGDGIISDLENTLTHEVGHLIGLDHTCYDGTLPAPPTDDMGNTIPNCFPESSLSLEIREATMYNFQNPGETKKVSLSDDDIEGFCAIYPLANDPMTCEPVDIGGKDGCCSSTASPAPPGRAGAALIVLLLGALLVVLRRRA
jgi:hypothetical protein